MLEDALWVIHEVKNCEWVSRMVMQIALCVAYDSYKTNFNTEERNRYSVKRLVKLHLQG
jgi:hypothetical protein